MGGEDRPQSALTDSPPVHFDFDYKADAGLPFAAHQRLRDAGPVLWSEPLGGWVVSSYATVRAVLSDLAHFTSQGTPIAAAAGAEAMLVTDTPLHNLIRGVWAKRVSKAAIAVRQQELESNAAAVLEPARLRLDAGESVDFIPLFQKYVMAFIASSFGVPRDRLQVFERWSQLSADTPALELVPGSEAHQRHLAAKEEVLDLVRDQVADRRRRLAAGELPDDYISLMVAADGQSGITPVIIVDNIFNFILGAMDTTEKWLGHIVLKICGSPDIAAELRKDRSLMEPFVNEVMRVDTVAQVIQRRVRDDGACLAGVNMKAGEQVYLMLGAANSDPAEFEHAQAFDLRRVQKLNLGFGFGFHHCLGINVARQEAVAFAGMLLDMLPRLRVAACDFGSSWALWGPRALFMTAGAP